MPEDQSQNNQQQQQQTTPPAPPTTPTPPNTATPPGQDGGQKTEGAKTFTQEQLDAIIAERLKRARENTTAELLKELGVEKPEDLKALVDSEKKRREAEMSEAEKAKAEVEAERKKREDAERKIAEMEQQQRNDRVNTAIKDAASAAQAQQPADVIMWVRQPENAALLEKIIDDKGVIDSKGIETIIAKAKEARPNWFTGHRKNPGSPSNGGSTTVEANRDEQKQARQSVKRSIRSGF